MYVPISGYKASCWIHIDQYERVLKWEEKVYKTNWLYIVGVNRKVDLANVVRSFFFLRSTR